MVEQTIFPDVIQEIERRLNPGIYYPMPLPQRIHMQWLVCMHDILRIKAIKLLNIYSNVGQNSDKQVFIPLPTYLYTGGISGKPFNTPKM
jgi:hypothetical protein